jgi:hypothetical protein
VAARFEVALQVAVVIDFAVEDDANGAIFVRDGLASALEVND